MIFKRILYSLDFYAQFLIKIKSPSVLVTKNKVTAIKYLLKGLVWIIVVFTPRKCILNGGIVGLWFRIKEKQRLTHS